MGAVPDITIEQYLKTGLLLNYPVADSFIETVLAKRNIPVGSMAFQRDANGNEDPAWVRKRELAMADLYFAAGTIMGGGGSSKQLGNRRYTDMSVTISAADREYWRALANQYYRKYGEVIPDQIDIYDASMLWDTERGGWNCGNH